MSVTKGFRFQNLDDRDYVLSIVNKIADIHKKNISVQGDAIVIMARAFDEGIKTIQFKDVPTSTKEVFNQVNCNFLKYDSELSGYMCYEFFYKKKKGEGIGAIDELVIQRCELCKKGKEDAKEREIQKQLLKVNIKKLLDLREILINLTQDLSLAQIYICKANLLEGHILTLSIDGIHMECPLEDDDSVSVIEHCYNQVDPMSMNPPCRYLIDPHIKVKMDLGEKATEIIEDLKQIEHRPEAPIIKDVEIVDVEIIEPEIIKELETTDSEKGINEYQDAEEKIEPEKDEEKKENEET